MLLAYRNDQFTIPHTSTCVIHTTGTINDGDIITITSPVFASTDFYSRSIMMSETLEVKIKLPNGSITNNEKDGSFLGTLVCDDNDVFNMYVKI